MWGVLLLLTLPLTAQPTRPEIYGQFGVLRLAGDEGSLGSGAAYGAAAIVPFTRRWALDIDVLTAKVESERPDPDLFSERRLLVAPSLVARWGTERFYGYAGGGVGLQSEFSRFRFQTYSGSPPQPSGIVSGKGTEHGMTLHGKVGFVISPVGRLLLRADFLLPFRYVLPSVGLKLGVGYRF